jgi:hypothetical protein
LANTVTFSNPVTISADTDVLTIGTTRYAAYYSTSAKASSFGNINLSGVSFTSSTAVVSATGITNSGLVAYTATVQSCAPNVFKINFVGAQLTIGASVAITLTNLQNGPLAAASTTGLATLAGTTVLDSTTTAAVQAVTASLRSVSVAFASGNPASAVGSSSGKVTITFTPTTVTNFNKVVVTLTGFTSTATIAVAEFSATITGSPAATAAVSGGVLTVTFTAGVLTAGQAASFTCTNIINPSAVQAAALPAVLAGRDVLVQAPTGAGKTGAFLLPLLAQLMADPATAEARPRRVLPTHWDNFFQPIQRGPSLMPGVDRDAARALYLSADPTLEWGVMDYGETITLPAQRVLP